jgi:hypothetical protein
VLRPFCAITPDRITLEAEHALAFHEGSDRTFLDVAFA